MDARQIEQSAEKALSDIRSKVLSNPEVVTAYNSFEAACLKVLEDTIKAEVAATAGPFVAGLISPTLDALEQRAAEALEIVQGAPSTPAQAAPAPATSSGPSLLERVESAFGIGTKAPPAPTKPATPAKPVNTRFGMRPPG